MCSACESMFFFVPSVFLFSPHVSPLSSFYMDDLTPRMYGTTDTVLLIEASVAARVLNPLNTKRRLLYLKTQFVLRSKHLSSRL